MNYRKYIIEIGHPTRITELAKMINDIRQFAVENYNKGIGKTCMFTGTQQLAYEKVIDFIDAYEEKG